jgi:predicted nucleic acid-binding protein
VSVALDTNVIVNVVSGTPQVGGLVAGLLRQHGMRSSLVISPVVYAELFAHPAWKPEELRAFLGATAVAVDWDLPQSVWTRAGEAFAQYAKRRRRLGAGGVPRRLLSDFVIGSHAVAAGALMTSDVTFFRKNFPELQVIAVSAASKS